MRLGNVIVPNASYGGNHRSRGHGLESIYNDRLKETGKTGADAWIGFGSIRLVWELGELASPTLSFIAWKTDSSCGQASLRMDGAQLFMFGQLPDFHIDTLADEQVMSDLTWDVRPPMPNGGGGISLNIW